MAQSGRYMANAVTLLSAVGATGSGSWMDVEGGIYQVHAEGTWNSSVLTLDAQGPNDTAIAIAGVSITANSPGTIEIRCVKGERVRATLTGGTPSGIYVRLVKAQE